MLLRLLVVRGRCFLGAVSACPTRSLYPLFLCSPLTLFQPRRCSVFPCHCTVFPLQGSLALVCPCQGWVRGTWTASSGVRCADEGPTSEFRNTGVCRPRKTPLRNTQKLPLQGSGNARYFRYCP